MNKTYLISYENLKTMAHGALGAMTFGAYNQFTTNKMMELNNEQMKLQNKVEIDSIKFQYQYSMDRMKSQHEYSMDKMETQRKVDMDKMEAQHKVEMNELRLKMDVIEKRSWW